MDANLLQYIEQLPAPAFDLAFDRIYKIGQELNYSANGQNKEYVFDESLWTGEYYGGQKDEN